MALKIKTLILLLLILLIPLSGIVEGFKDRMNPNHHSLYRDGNRMMKYYYYSRKLHWLNSLLDYDDAGPNTKHEPNPRGKNRPGGSRNVP